MFYELTQESTSGTFLFQNICKENAHKIHNNLISMIMTHVINTFITP